MDDDRTVLEGLDADHVRLLAESAELKDAMRRVVNELRKTAEPGVQTSLADKLSELGRTLAATERERGAVLQRIEEELGERMNDSFEKRYSQQQICHTKRQKCADGDACSYFVCGGGSSGSSSSESDSDFLDDGSGGRDDDSDSDLDPRSGRGDGDSAAVHGLGQQQPQEQGARFEQTKTAATKRKRLKKQAKKAATKKRVKPTPSVAPLNPGKVSSKFYGVGWHKSKQKWQAYVRHNGKQVDLGSNFDTEIAAAKAVDVWLRENGRAAEANFDESGSFVPRVSTESSKYRGVCWYKKSKKWQARITVAGKREWLGDFDDEVEAAKAYDLRARQVGYPPNFDLNGVEIDYSA